MCTNLNKGMLYLLLENNEVVALIYPKKDIPENCTEFSYQTIASVYKGKTEFDLGGGFFYRYDWVEIKKATNRDIEKLLAEWECRVTLSEWAYYIREYCDNLAQEEKSRISHLVSGWR